MQLSLHNIGKVQEADVAIDGITVIAGENNTGKSTVGKALYSVFSSFYHLEEHIEDQRHDQLFDTVLPLVRLQRRGPKISAVDLIVSEILKSAEYGMVTKEALVHAFASVQGLEKSILGESDDTLRGMLGEINETLSITDDELICAVLNNEIQKEFEGQISNFRSPRSGSIRLALKEDTVDVAISDDSVLEVAHPIPFYTEIVYIDDPFVLDESASSQSKSSHRNDLLELLTRQTDDNSALNEILAQKKLDAVLHQLNSVCKGSLQEDRLGGVVYQDSESERSIPITNLSTGLKTFAILKTLLLNGSLKRRGTLILDEPEIHLHPEWQIIFAEIIVLLQREFDMHILLNTHSPYFIEAIDVYSRKYETSKRCHYYQAKTVGANSSEIVEVSDRLEEIYKSLAAPFQELENVKASL